MRLPPQPEERLDRSRAVVFTFRGKQVHAYGGDILEMPTNQRPNQIDVVNHEVEHDRDVGAARIEGCEPIALDESRPLDVRERSANCPVEPLDVSRLDQGAGALRQRQELVRLAERRRDRLLDE